MASITHSIPSSGTLYLHGEGVANSGSYPVISLSFDITFTRASGSSTVSWVIDNIDWDHPTSGKFGYEFISNVQVAGATLAYSNEIIRKDNTVADSWWNYTTVADEITGSFTNTDTSNNPKITINVYVEAGHCLNANTGNFCFGSSGDYLVYSTEVTIPSYMSTYTITYDANGGSGAPSPQTKTSAQSSITISSQVPTNTLLVNYFNDESVSQPSDIVTIYKEFQYWQAYYNADSTNAVTFTGDGTTTTFPTTSAGFDPEALSIKSVKITPRISGLTYSLVNNHIVFSSAPANGALIRITYVKPTQYSNPGNRYRYEPNPPSRYYEENASCWMVAQWGPATFTPIALPDKYVTITFNYNGGIGTPPITAILCQPLGYDTSPSSTSYPYVPGTSATTSTNLNLYPKYGNATLPYAQLPVPTKPGFVFEGWYYDSGFTNKIVSDIVTDHDIIIYARWTALPLYQFTPNGDWQTIGPYVYRMGSDHQWHQVSHVMKFDGTNWIDISG